MSRQLEQTVEAASGQIADANARMSDAKARLWTALSVLVVFLVAASLFPIAILSVRIAQWLLAR